MRFCFKNSQLERKREWGVGREVVGYPGKEIDTGVCKHGKGRIAGSEGKGRGRAFHQSVGEPGSKYAWFGTCCACCCGEKEFSLPSDLL